MTRAELAASAISRGSGFRREEPAAMKQRSALQWGLLQIATTSRFRRQKTTTHAFIAKSHKTVHTFFDEF
jgi:hypothetical protein